MIGRILPKTASVVRTRFAIVGTSMLAAAALGGCGVKGSPADSSAAGGKSGTTVVRVIYQPSGLSSYFYANAKGLWAKYGLKVMPIPIQAGQNELAPLVSGSADFAFLGGPPTVTAIEKDVPVRIIFSTNDVSHLEGLVVPKNSPIKSIRDVAGKTIAVPTGSSAWAGMQLGLAKAGIPFSSVHTVNLQPSAALAAFEAGNVQGAWIWDTWIERMMKLGGHVVALEHSYGIEEPNSWVASDKIIKSHPQIVEKFIEALNAGAIGVNKNPQPAVSQFSSLTGITPAEAKAIMKTEPTFGFNDALSKSSPLSFANPVTGFARALYRSGNVLARAGIVPSAPPISKIQNAIDVNLVRKAAQASG